MIDKHFELYHQPKDGDSVILFPKPKITWEEFFAAHEPCPDFELDRSENGPPQERDSLDPNLTIVESLMYRRGVLGE